MTYFHKLAALAALCVLGAAAQAGSVLFIDGHAMIPLRSLGESFGASISYNSRRNDVDISLDYRKTTVRPGYRTVWIGGRQVELETHVILRDGVTYVPVSLLSRIYGYQTRWDNAAREYVIVRPQAQRRVIVLTCDARKPEARKHPRYHDRKQDEQRKPQASYQKTHEAYRNHGKPKVTPPRGQDQGHRHGKDCRHGK